MSSEITRRDFIDGVACTIVAGTAFGSTPARPAAGVEYPPSLTGMRGSREQDFAAAHAVRDGAKYRIADYPLAEEVDYAVIGAGIGGLSAAYFLRKARPQARVLILDDHDDFGGHARRNEFHVDGRLLIGYGGSESIQSPKTLWSRAALGLLADLGVHLDRFERAINTRLYPGLGLSSGIFFAREAFGQDKLVTGDPQRSLPSDIPAALHHGRPIAEFAADCPLSDPQRRGLVDLYTARRDVLPGLSRQQKLDLLSRISYQEFLEKYWELDSTTLQLLVGRTIDLFALAGNLVPALEAADTDYPGFQGLGLDLDADQELIAESEPYIHHFPDGNASIARLLVRRLIPQVARGNSMEDIVTARFAYDELDRDGRPVRLRLSSTVVRLANAGPHVDVLYVHAGGVRRVRCRHAIYAGYYAMLPYLCGELPAAQRAAVAAGVRSPLVYVTVAVRNWRPWVRMGVHLVTNPTGFYNLAKLDFPVSLGRYRFARTPDEPMLVHLSHTPQPPTPTPDRRASVRAARMVLFTRPFADFEAALRDELTRILGPGGFDADRDIAAITVNRWGHGYACSLNELSDPGASDALAVTARQRVGRISLAGSDAAWSAYAHAAIDEAHRAAAEVVARSRKAGTAA